MNLGVPHRGDRLVNQHLNEALYWQNSLAKHLLFPPIPDKAVCSVLTFSFFATLAGV